MLHLSWANGPLSLSFHRPGQPALDQIDRDFVRYIVYHLPGLQHSTL